MRLNWRIVLGCIMIIAGCAELMDVLKQMESGEIEPGPGNIVGIGMGMLIWFAACYYLVSTGRKNLRKF